MNTRKYPRTLNEAFPRTADYASAIERTRNPDVMVMKVAGWCAAALGLFMLIGWVK